MSAARALIYQTARAYAAGEYPVREISMCKLLATQIVWDVARDERLRGEWRVMDTDRLSMVRTPRST
ncbi:MAG: acyl-CoA/acyl-ACP dehydrogenase [Pseudonocardiales bacterium]|nr:acyl-CoA/acyl-ACP dehydrogenase [Pseudonocardiales bacterium]